MCIKMKENFKQIKIFDFFVRGSCFLVWHFRYRKH